MKTLSTLISQQNLSPARQPISSDSWRLMDQIRTEGCIVLVKLDGERTKDFWTLVIQGGPLGEALFRKDGNDPEAMIREGANFYDSLIWSEGGGRSPRLPDRRMPELFDISLTPAIFQPLVTAGPVPELRRHVHKGEG